MAEIQGFSGVTLPSNSNISKNIPIVPDTAPARPKGKVTVRSESPFKRIISDFIEGDAKTVGNYIWNDIIVPNGKNLLHDIVDKGSERMLWSDGPGRPSSGRRQNYTSYSAPRLSSGDTYRQSTPPWSTPSTPSYSAPERQKQRDGGFNYGELIFTSNDDALTAYDNIRTQLEETGFVTIYDLYLTVSDSNDIYGASPLTYTDEYRGWYNLNDMTIKRVRNGWWLKMPPAVEISEMRGKGN